MINPAETSTDRQRKYFGWAYGLALFTIVYNAGEGVLATWFGIQDESFTLFGFGTDSFVEILSGVGVAHMIVRVRKNPEAGRDDFERTALRITGTAFYLLTAGLVVASVLSVVQQHRPETTRWGLLISLVSILVMGALVYGKKTLGTRLRSPAIRADAECTKVCLYMSLILLGSSAVYELTHLPYIDAAGTLGLAYFSFTEGRECFEKARHDDVCSC